MNDRRYRDTISTNKHLLRMVAMETLPSFDRVEVLVLGDCILDRYIHGTATRISPEAPVPVVDVAEHAAGLGGAANVAAGVAGLGGSVTLFGVVGDDDDGRTLRTLAEAAGINATVWLTTELTGTICKTRVVAERNQQLLRLDRDGDSTLREKVAGSAIPEILAELPGKGAIVLADYEKGSLPADLIREVIARCRQLGIPVIVDPKKRDFTPYSEAFVVTPNRLELERAVGRRLRSMAEVADAAEEVRVRFSIAYLICTCGPDGMVIAGSSETSHVPTRAIQVADVTGAGDTVVATIAVAIGTGRCVVEACRLAALTAGIAVSRPRVHVVTRRELEVAVISGCSKLIEPELLPNWLAPHRLADKRIVFTNGCFDVLHAGHLSSLEEAKRHGDLLIVGLNSDGSVRRLKGASRPRISQRNRAALLAGLSCVDAVVIFDEDTPHEIIRTIKPDVLAKGGDYTSSQIAGADIVRSYGGKVAVLEFVAGLSTTEILGERA